MVMNQFDFLRGRETYDLGGLPQTARSTAAVFRPRTPFSTLAVPQSEKADATV